jgi:hypothetical protein
MTDTVNNTSVTTLEDHRLNARIFRVMTVVTALAVMISLFISPWRVTVGLLLGGVLGLFSHHWLKSSSAAAISLAVGGGVQQIRLMQFILRYLVVGAAVFAAYEAGIASLPAMLIGLSSFVVAILAEALREFYFAIIQREEIS